MKTIIDLGVSEGNDTAFYLAKGFRVIAVEADLDMFRGLQKRFEREIAAGDLILLNRAASDSCDRDARFYVHSVHQGVSGLRMNKDLSPDGYKAPYDVKTIDWEQLLTFGIPHYVKIDIEDNETKFLGGMAGSSVLPQFISVECHTLEPVETLFAMGYRRFKLIDQNAPSGFQLPRKQLEGRQVENPDFFHASGPFGLDVFEVGEWGDLEQFKVVWQNAQVTRSRTWYDCHAWEPSFASMTERKSIVSSLKRWKARFAPARAK